MIIEESGMRFGEYPDDSVFHIERCQQYQKHLMPNGVKTCEFILLRDSVLYFVEAKQSCPNQISENTIPEKISKYNAYINDITTKVRHSFALYASILLERCDTAGVPKELLKRKLSNRQFKVILVVKDAQKTWLIPLREKLEKELSAERRIWNAQLFVINEDHARRKHFIL